MKIVLTCGHPHSGYQLAHEALVSFGLEQAQPSQNGSLLPVELQEKILKMLKPIFSESGSIIQLSPGKKWKELADGLLSGQLGEGNWGWADANTIWLLEFWKEFDPRLRFVLVYSAPALAISQTLLEVPFEPERVHQAIEEWVVFNSEMLRFYNRNLDRCLLVNISDVIRFPVEFVEKADETLGLGIDHLPASYQIVQPPIPAIALNLTKELLDDFHEATALYQELQSSADLGGAEIPVIEAEKFQAWQEYTLLLSTLDEAVREIGEERGRAGLLLTQIDELQQSLEIARQQEAKFTEAQAGYQAEIVYLQSMGKEAAEETERLLFQLSQFQQAHEGNLLKIREGEAAKEAIAVLREQLADCEGRLGHWQAQAQELSVSKDELQQSLENARQQEAKFTEAQAGYQAEIVYLQSIGKEAIEETERLLFQLSQFQQAHESNLLKLQEGEAAKEALAVLREQFADCEGRLGHWQAQVQELSVSQNEMARIIVEQQGDLEAKNAESIELQSTIAKTSQQNFDLLLQLHQVQEEFEASVAQANDKIAFHEAAISEKQAQLARQASQVVELQENLEAKDKEIKNLRNVMEENSLLLLQLHQTQEELEALYIKSQANEDAEKSLAKARQEVSSYETKLRELQARLEQQTKAKDEQAKLAAERKSQLDQANKAKDEQAKLAADRKAKLDQANKAKDEQAKLEAERKAQLDQANKAKDEQAKLAAERKAQLDQANKAKDEQAKLAADRKAQLDQANKAKDEQAKLAAERKAQLDQAVKAKNEQTSIVAELRKSLEAKNIELKQQQAEKALSKEIDAKTKGLAEENEFLLLQLHQVQEELESQFLQYQQTIESSQQIEARLAKASTRIWYDSSLSEVVFDLRRELNGDNWYQAEADGRWAGPDRTSTLRIPALPRGHYEVEFNVVDAMAPEILLGMEVFLNGKSLILSDDWEGYPALIRARFFAEKTDDRSMWEFQFNFPKLISPAENGSDDERKLAIRVGSLKLTLID